MADASVLLGVNVPAAPFSSAIPAMVASPSEPLSLPETVPSSAMVSSIVPGPDASEPSSLAQAGSATPGSCATFAFFDSKLAVHFPARGLVAAGAVEACAVGAALLLALVGLPEIGVDGVEEDFAGVGSADLLLVSDAAELQPTVTIMKWAATNNARAPSRVPTITICSVVSKRRLRDNPYPHWLGTGRCA